MVKPYSLPVRAIIYVPAGARTGDELKEDLRQKALRDGYTRDDDIGFADTPAQVWAIRAAEPVEKVYCRLRHRADLVPPWVIGVDPRRNRALGGALMLGSAAWVLERFRRHPARWTTATAVAMAGVALAAAVVLKDGPENPRQDAEPPPPAVSTGPGDPRSATPPPRPPSTTSPSAHPPTARTLTPPGEPERSGEPEAGGGNGEVGDQGAGAGGPRPTPTRSESRPPVGSASPTARPPTSAPATSSPPAAAEDDCLLGLDVDLWPVLTVGLCVG